MTTEQAAIVTFIKEAMENGKDEVVLVPAVAGAGKTYLLQQIVSSVPHTSGMYLSYNKSIANEAATKFPKSIKCLTANALAYRNTVKSLGLRVGAFTYRDVEERCTYEYKVEIIATLKEYCLSSFLCFDSFAKDRQVSGFVAKAVKKYLELMFSGKIECTHDFYMKTFHMYLAEGRMVFEKEDFLMIDESGDLNEVTLEIFKLFPAKIKIAVGDSSQNIYGFNHTINAFSLMRDEGTTFKLSKSFRVSEKIAGRIEAFCKKHIDKDMVFTGVPLTDSTINSRAVITRTNSGLVSCIMDLLRDGTHFNLVRSPAEVFKVPLMLSYLKYQGNITDPAYKHIQDDVDEWYEMDPKLRPKSLYGHLLSLYPEDVQLTAALRLVQRWGKQEVIRAYEETVANNKKPSSFILATAHVMKGLEVDEVIIHDSLNDAIKAVYEAYPDKNYGYEALQELNLYYVACSRARKSLINAICL